MEVGSKYRIVYRDQDYTKLISGKLLFEDAFTIEIDDIKIGKIIIGKNALTSAKKIEVGELDEKNT